MRESHTTVLERNRLWKGVFQTEPYEAAWAGEAIFFVRALEVSGSLAGCVARVQISPDGVHWCDEGTSIAVPDDAGVTFGRVKHFGTHLRLAGELPEGAEMKVIVYLVLKE